MSVCPQFCNPSTSSLFSFKIHGPRFARYVFSGGTANVVDIGLFLILTHVGVYFLYASIMSGVCAFFAAFFLHKYVTYQAKGGSQKHFVRFCILTLGNFAAQNAILYLAVEEIGAPEGWAKVFANASAVLWNFFLYKRFVYRT